MRKSAYRCSQCGKSHETIKGAFDCACRPAAGCGHDNWSWDHVNISCSDCGRQITEQYRKWVGNEN